MARELVSQFFSPGGPSPWHANEESNSKGFQNETAVDKKKWNFLSEGEWCVTTNALALVRLAFEREGRGEWFDPTFLVREGGGRLGQGMSWVLGAVKGLLCCGSNGIWNPVFLIFENSFHLHLSAAKTKTRGSHKSGVEELQVDAASRKSFFEYELTVIILVPMF